MNKHSCFGISLLCMILMGILLLIPVVSADAGYAVSPGYVTTGYQTDLTGYPGVGEGEVTVSSRPGYRGNRWMTGTEGTIVVSDTMAKRSYQPGEVMVSVSDPSDRYLQGSAAAVTVTSAGSRYLIRDAVSGTILDRVSLSDIERYNSRSGNVFTLTGPDVSGVVRVYDREDGTFLGFGS